MLFLLLLVLAVMAGMWGYNKLKPCGCKELT